MTKWNPDEFTRSVMEEVDRVSEREPQGRTKHERRKKNGHDGQASGASGAEDPKSKTTISATPFTWIDPTTIPPRQFLYGRHLIRQFLSTTISHGGVGKTTLEIVEALAQVSNKPLLGVQPNGPLRVWYWNGEDPKAEIDRRVMAAALHFGLTPDDIGDRLFIDSGRLTPIVVAVQTKDGTKIATPIVNAVIQEIQEKRIDVMIVDPFVASHRVTENDNNAIEAVAKNWSHIADVTNSAIELAHHSRKTAAEVTVQDGRGAIALLAAARSARVLNVMSETEAAQAGVDKRKWFFRADNGKANLTAPVDKAEWFTFVSIDLGNGDQVGVSTFWTFPNAFSNITAADLRAAQQAVAEGGPWRESKQADDWVGKPIAQALKLDAANKAHQKQISTLLKTWIDNGMFVRVERIDPKRRTLKCFIEVGQRAN